MLNHVRYLTVSTKVKRPGILGKIGLTTNEEITGLTSVDKTILLRCKEHSADWGECLNACRPYVNRSGLKKLASRGIVWKSINRLISAGLLKEV